MARREVETTTQTNRRDPGQHQQQSRNDRGRCRKVGVHDLHRNGDHDDVAHGAQSGALLQGYPGQEHYQTDQECRPTNVHAEMSGNTLCQNPPGRGPKIGGKEERFTGTKEPQANDQ